MYVSRAMGERKGGGGEGRKEIAESLTIPVPHKGTNDGRCVLSTDGYDREDGVS